MNVIKKSIDCVVIVELIKTSTMKRTIIISLLMLIAFEGLAQRVRPTVQTEEEKREMYRKEIGLDYSVPDFFVNKIDEEKMGKRNAAILRSLEVNYKQRQYNQVLATILYEQQNINKVSIIEITKICVKCKRK